MHSPPPHPHPDVEVERGEGLQLTWHSADRSNQGLRGSGLPAQTHINSGVGDEPLMTGVADPSRLVAISQITVIKHLRPQGHPRETKPCGRLRRAISVFAPLCVVTIFMLVFFLFLFELSVL